MNDELKSLEDAYIKAAVALRKYQKEHGFDPGIRVTTSCDYVTRSGTIAKYGKQWSTVDHMSVPVVLDSGVCQPWHISDLKICDASSVMLQSAP